MENSKFKILIVDDVPSNIQLVAIILQENENYELFFSNDGLSALKLVKEEDLDLILLDVMMPGMNGFDVCKEIKSNPRTQNIPIIFLTAKSELKSLVKGFEVGGQDYVSKPFNALELQARVETHLKLRQTMKKLSNTNRQIKLELQIAKEIQKGIIPDNESFPEIKELTIYSYYNPLESIGGDLFDVIKVNDRKYAFVMADVSGHGVPAALVSSMAKGYFLSITNEKMKPSDICKEINNKIMKHSSKIMNYFLSAFYIILDIETGEIEYTSAGHHPAILYRSDKDVLESLETQGNLIGAFDEATYETMVNHINVGDRILLYTDGVIETRNKNGEYYNQNILNEFVKNNSKLPPEIFVNNLIKDIEKFASGMPIDDDIAILYFEYTSQR